MSVVGVAFQPDLVDDIEDPGRRAEESAGAGSFRCGLCGVGLRGDQLVDFLYQGAGSGWVVGHGIDDDQKVDVACVGVFATSQRAKGNYV